MICPPGVRQHDHQFDKQLSHMIRYRVLLVTTLLVATRTTLFAQSDNLLLTLVDCIRIARASGPLATIARRTFEGRQSSYQGFFAGFYPQLTLQGDLPGYYRSINTIILPDGSSVFTPQSQASSSLSLALSQRIPLTGGELSVSSGLNRIDLLESNSQYYRSSPLSVSYRQPILQINTMKWNKESEELRYQIAGREFAEALEDCALDVTNRFFDLYLASMNSSNAALNLANNDTLYQISKGRFNVGKIAENDLLQSELAFLNAQTQFENARLALNRSEQNLRIALALPPPTRITLIAPSTIPPVSIDPSVALLQAQRNRSDVVNFELQKLTAERNVVQAKSDNFLAATMTANLGYNQRAQVLSDAYQNLLDQRQFSIRFDFPILQWGAGRLAVDAAMADQKRIQTSVEQQRNNFDQEIVYQVSRLNMLQKQVAVAAKADTIAQRRFDVAKDRYLIGKIDVPNLFLAQNEKDNARRTRIQTLWDFWTTYFRVRRLTLYDFQAKQSLIEEKATQ